MNKTTKSKLLAYLLTCGIMLSGCGKKSDCEIPTRHVHRYTKDFGNEIVIENYFDSEDLSHRGYKWNSDYIEINKYDEELYKVLNHKSLFDGVSNWRYLYNYMASSHDYLMFYYEYTTTEERTTTDSKGNTKTETVTVHHDGWHDDPNDYDNTGDVRLYHHRFYGYRVVYNNGSFRLERSPYVDDIREIIYDYPYFCEECDHEVYEEFKFRRRELKNLRPEDFDVFNQPDLANPDLDSYTMRLKTQ